MDIFRQHEVFEIEVLDKMNSARLLEPVVFGGGTMLRLCHELPRYSVDLVFWFIKRTPQNKFFDNLQRVLENDYEITDAQIKRYTLLLELRSARYPKRLKIEIRRTMKECTRYARYGVRSFILGFYLLCWSTWPVPCASNSPAPFTT